MKAIGSRPGMVNRVCSTQQTQTLFPVRRASGQAAGPVPDRFGTALELSGAEGLRHGRQSARSGRWRRSSTRPLSWWLISALRIRSTPACVESSRREPALLPSCRGTASPQARVRRIDLPRPTCADRHAADGSPSSPRGCASMGRMSQIPPRSEPNTRESARLGKKNPSRERLGFRYWCAVGKRTMVRSRRADHEGARSTQMNR